jgi:hypothetical protein
MYQDPNIDLLIWQLGRWDEERHRRHRRPRRDPSSTRRHRRNQARRTPVAVAQHAPAAARGGGGPATGQSTAASEAPTSTVRFARHLMGPPGSANGGVVAGTLASHLDVDGDRPIEVRLHRRIPLEDALSIERSGTTTTLRYGSDVAATARYSTEVVADRGPVAADAARRCRPVVTVDAHPAPDCFVCGPHNGRGLHLEPGDVDGTELLATTWWPPQELADARGQLPAPIVWAALDCPSWYGAARCRPALLGTITARCLRPITVGAPVVVSGWGVRRDGRKSLGGSAIHDVDGELLAVASAIWIHPKEGQ